MRPFWGIRGLTNEWTVELSRFIFCRKVESKVGAVTWGFQPTSRFPPPLIEPCVRVYRTRLSGWLHCEAHGGALSGKRSRRRRPIS